MMSPLTATDWPNMSEAVPAKAVSLALSVRAPFQPPTGLTNTRADLPLLPASLSATMTTTSPLTATEMPNWVTAARSKAVNLAC